MKYLVVATPEELELPEAFLSKRRKIVTGVGGVNVFRALDKLSRNADILNVGYAGSQWYAKGTPVRIGTCRLYHPNCEYTEPSFTLDAESDALCLTAGDFVTDGMLPARSVVDMELAYIAAMGFRVKAVKYVSDNLNYEEYEKTKTKTNNENQNQLTMFEKVNPSHPDKMADRLAGAIVDMAYAKSENPKIAVEVLAGHGKVYVIIETSLSSEQLRKSYCEAAIHRIFGKDVEGEVIICPQDEHLADNQRGAVRCGDNGIFKGSPVTHEQQLLTDIAASIYERWPYDGKYIVNLDVPMLTICQSNANESDIANALFRWSLNYSLDDNITYPNGNEIIINPLGEWTGGPGVDCGATNRKLGSDMGDGVTGGGLHGKDLSKADVSVNIYCHLLAQRERRTVCTSCSIGDTDISFKFGSSLLSLPYEYVVDKARQYINELGGFEKFAEWGLIRPIRIKN